MRPPAAVGIVGLGVMGAPMAERLVTAGYRVTVHNRSRAAVERLVAGGAIVADSPAEVAAAAEVVITVLPDTPDVQAVATGERGLFAGAAAGSFWVDMSTISPSASALLRLVEQLSGRDGRQGAGRGLRASRRLQPGRRGGKHESDTCGAARRARPVRQRGDDRDVRGRPPPARCDGELVHLALARPAARARLPGADLEGRRLPPRAPVHHQRPRRPPAEPRAALRRAGAT